MGSFKDELVLAESGLSSSSSLESNTLGRFEEGADAAVMGDLEACTTAVCAAIAFTLYKLDCKSGSKLSTGSCSIRDWGPRLFWRAGDMDLSQSPMDT